MASRKAESSFEFIFTFERTSTFSWRRRDRMTRCRFDLAEIEVVRGWGDFGVDERIEPRTSALIGLGMPKSTSYGRQDL